MALPLSRDFTLAKGDALPAALMNDLQDQIISLHGSLTNMVQTFGAEAGQPQDPVVTTLEGLGASLFFWRVNGTANHRVFFPVRAPAGWRLNTAGLWVQPEVASPGCSVELYRYDPILNAGVQIGSTLTSSGTDRQLLELTDLNELVSADYIYRLVFIGSGVSGEDNDVFGGRFTVSR